MTWLDLLGWGGSALLIFSLLQARVLRFRVLNLISCVVLTIFNGILEIWPMVAMNVVLCLINLWFIVKLVRERHDDQAFSVLSVGPTDRYLQHVLRVHGEDIHRHQPDLDAAQWSTAADRQAYLVQRGDETVGVVLLHLDGDNAQVDLDYVTPRFRDFSPGEFVWRESGLLRDAGVRRVVTPARMKAPYYDRVGFRPYGDAWALDLEPT